MAWPWTMGSPLLMAKRDISFGTVKKFPTFIVCSLLSVKALSHSDKKRSFQHRHVLVRRMPMRGNRGLIGAPYPQNAGRGFSIHVSRDRCEIASLNYRCPFQIAQAHDLVRLDAFPSLLAESRH